MHFKSRLVSPQPSGGWLNVATVFRILFKIIATNLVVLLALYVLDYCFLLMNAGDTFQLALGETALPAIPMVGLLAIYTIWKKEISKCFDVLAKAF